MNLLIKITLFFLLSCSTTKTIVSDQALQEILSLHKTNGGATYCFHLRGNMQHTQFFAVGVYPQRGKVLPRKMKFDDLKRFAQVSQDLLHQEYCLGTWVDEKKNTFIDIVKVVPLSAGRHKAIELAREHKQVAIYNLYKDTVIKVPKN